MPSKAVVEAAQKEYASRLLAKRKLMPFVKRMNPRYRNGWVHDDIAERLERFSQDVVDGKSPRLMILMPPRHGKSELASRLFPAWHLGNYPDHEFIACSYNSDLAMSFSRKVQQSLQDPAYQVVFQTRLDPNNQSVSSWGVVVDGAERPAAGAYLPAGIGGPITGKGAHCLVIDDPCVSQGSLVRTATGLVAVEDVCVGDMVLTHKGRWRKVLATYDQGVKNVVELSAGEKRIRLTPEHKVYTSTGWVPASEAQDVYVEELPDLPEAAQGESEEVLLDGVLGGIAARCAQVLRAVWTGVSAGQGFGPEVLWAGLPSRCAPGAEAPGLSALRQGVRDDKAGAEILLPGAQSCDVARGAARQETSAGCAADVQGAHEIASEGVAGKAVRYVFAALRAVSHVPAVLWARLQERGAFAADARAEQFELSAWSGDRSAHAHVQAGVERADAGAASGVHGVWCDEVPVHAPHGRGQEERRVFELRCPVQLVPHKVAQVIESGRARVYDLTVEEDHSFVAEGFVVHNCKNAEEADSAEQRSKVWEWYLSTAYSRLAPGGGILIIQTWWHDDDLAGKIQQVMADARKELEEARGTDGEADAQADFDNVDMFEIVKYPAIATEDEWLDEESHEIVPECSADKRHRLLRRRGEALHPARYDLRKLNRIRRQNRRSDGSDGRWWSALYQQNPVPEDGNYFTKDQFRVGPGPRREECYVFQAWDFAITEKKVNDWTVGMTGYLDVDDVLHIVEVHRFKSQDTYKIVNAILDMAKRHDHPSLLLGLEDGQIYKTMLPVLKKRMEERIKSRESPRWLSVEALKPITDKQARARPLQARMQSGKVSWLRGAGWFDTARAEFLRFPAGVHDDQVDTGAWLATLVVGKQAPRPPEKKKMESWRDQLGENALGELSHMAS